MNTAQLSQSIEAERAVLSACFLDGKAMVPMCLDAGLQSASFGDRRHALVFSRLVSLHSRSPEVIDLAVVAEDLRRTGELDAIGGFPFLLTISAQLSTTIQAAYFVERVRALHLQRESISAAKQFIAAAAQTDAATAQQLAADLRAHLETIDRSRSSVAQRISARRFNPASAPPAPREIYRIGKVPICTAGNLSNLTAEAKVGKSAFAGAMLAAPFACEGADCLTVSASNPKGHALVHIDTECSASDWFKSLCRVKRRAGVEDFPPWLVSYHFTGWSAAECRTGVAAAVDQAQREFGGIFAIMIDGVADLVVDPNDGEECFPFVMELHGMAIKYDTAVINVLHVNPGTAKTRGHLGSQLERKAETNLVLEKAEDGTTVVYGLKQRGACIPKADGPRFRWSDGEGMHVSCETARVAGERVKQEKLSELAREVFAACSTLKFSDLQRAVMATADCSERTADSRIGDMRRLGIIKRFPPNLYTIAA